MAGRQRSRRCAPTNAVLLWLWLLWLVVVVLLCWQPLLEVVGVAAATPPSSAPRQQQQQQQRRSSSRTPIVRSPYTVFGVSHHASSEEIKRRYRQLCLLYHPDKQRQRTVTEQKKYERLFKELQAAYSEIGTPEARRQYDWNARHSSSSTTSSSRSGGGGGGGGGDGHPLHDEMKRAFERAFAAGSRSSSTSSTTTASATSFSGFNVHDLFNINSNSAAFPLWNAGATMKSIFVFHVAVPLEDLYTGRPHFRFAVRDNLWQRVRAAFRGNIGYLILYQSVLYSLPLLRVSGTLATLWGLFLFQHYLPRMRPIHNTNHNDNTDTPRLFVGTAHLRAGYKGGTKFIFDERHTGQPGVEVHVIVKEAPHAIYRRQGHDLHVTCQISPSLAETGGRMELPSLLHNPNDNVLRVDIPAGSRHGDILLFPGQGWPDRKRNGTKGNLIVTVALDVPPWRRSKRRNSGKTK